MRTIQILINLISNAIKFSPENSKIDIECRHKPSELGKILIEISVVDYGIGIDTEDQKNIFNPFFKTKSGESKALNATSHGIGLNIC
jgi:signal transduction histidine kinase